MWKSILPLLILSTAGNAAVQTVTPTDSPENIPPLHSSQQMQPSIVQSYMIIPPAARASDFVQAFDMLRKEKTAGKVYFQLSDGTAIANVIDMTLMPNSTLFLFRFNSSQGIRFQVVKVEDILYIGY